jgi:hypothetical protein
MAPPTPRQARKKAVQQMRVRILMPVEGARNGPIDLRALPSDGRLEARD